MQGATNLSVVVDELWRCSSDRLELARTVVKRLTTDDWLILTGWDFAATFGPISGSLTLIRPQLILVSDDWNRPLYKASLIRLDNFPNYSPLISYSGTNLGVIADWLPPAGRSGDVNRDPAMLLVALQFIRDHMDSTLLSPKALRLSRISSFADHCSLDDDYFRRLASWLSAITPYL